MNQKMKHLILILLSIIYCNHLIAAPTKDAPWVGQAFDGRYCEGHAPKFGPYDYLIRHSLPYELHIVEQYHFNTDVENLVKGMTTSPLGDINYVLGAWPNHHRALYSVIRHRISSWKNNNSLYKRTPAECYLERAINFSPEDATTRMLYAMLLQSTGHEKQALTQYRKALEAEPAHVQAQYNMGLLLVDMKEYDEANEIAKNLYSRGYPLPGLKNKLIKAKIWHDSSEKGSSE